MQTDTAARQEMMQRGFRGVPAFIIGNEAFVGLDYDRIEQAIDYKVQACPSCGNKLRIPKGKGKIRITCPHCKQQFIQQTS